MHDFLYLRRQARQEDAARMTIRRRIAEWLTEIAWRIWHDPDVVKVYNDAIYRVDYGSFLYTGPIAREDVEDIYGGVAPVGRRVL